MKMSEKEEWTVVSSSKSRPKKPSIEEENSCRNNNGQTKKKHSLPMPNVVGIVHPPFRNYHPNRRPDTSKTSQNLSKSRPRPTAYISECRKDAKIHENRNIVPTTHGLPVPTTSKIYGSEHAKFKPMCTDSSNKLLAKCPDPKGFDVCVQPGVSKNNNVFPKQIRDNNNGLTPRNVGTLDAPKKKVKRKNKEDRRKKREEKFYQALYQNKDSHIQFVSADMIRKLQNDQRVPASKPASTQKLFPSPTVQTDTPQSLNTKALQSNFEDFPSLTPVKCIKKSPEVKLSNVASGPSDVSKLSISESLWVKVESNVSEDDKQLSQTLNFCDSINTETPADKAKTTSILPSSSKGKKSKQPMIIDVSSLIINKKKERDLPRKCASISTAYGRTGFVKKENFKITAGNPLDSSGPGVINRGKIRQKKKKPTKLKLNILKSRALKRILLEEENRQNFEKILANKNAKVEVSFDEVMKAQTDVDNISDELASRIEEVAIDAKAEAVPKKEVELDANNSFEEDFTEYVDVKTEDIVNKENVFSDNDMSLKFIKLLDEISMMKITDEALSPEVEVAVKASMHNRKFRDYCDMYTSKELHRLVMNLLSELFRFQDRLYHTDPIKFKTKRRFVSGLKEALSYLNLNKVQLIIIAPDIEKNPEPGGLDEKITQILTVANGKGVPYVFSGSKYNLGKSMRIKTPISIISVLDKQNCEDTFRALLEEANQLREKYHNDFAFKAKELKGQEK